MSSLFRLDSSIRQAGSVTREIADTLQAAWTEEHPVGTITNRDLGASPVPTEAWAAVVSAMGATELTGAQQAGVDLATALADELLAGDAIVIAAPLYNWGVSAYLKSYIDLLLTDPRFQPGTTPLAGRPLALVVARGGGYAPGTPKEGWDHATPYMMRIFRDQLGADVTLVETELTLADVNPAMAGLRDKAAELKAQAHELADETGRALAKLVA